MVVTCFAESKVNSRRLWKQKGEKHEKFMWLFLWVFVLCLILAEVLSASKRFKSNANADVLKDNDKLLIPFSFISFYPEI